MGSQRVRYNLRDWITVNGNYTEYLMFFNGKKWISFKSRNTLREKRRKKSGKRCSALYQTQNHSWRYRAYSKEDKVHSICGGLRGCQLVAPSSVVWSVQRLGVTCPFCCFPVHSQNPTPLSGGQTHLSVCKSWSILPPALPSSMGYPAPSPSPVLRSLLLSKTPSPPTSGVCIGPTASRLHRLYHPPQLMLP